MRLRYLVSLSLVSLLALAVAAALPVSRLSGPLFVAGLCGCGALMEGLRLLLTRAYGERAPAALALVAGLGSLAIALWLSFVRVPPAPDAPGAPEPIDLYHLALVQAHAVAAVVAVFAALSAARERAAAVVGLTASAGALALLGRHGVARLPDQVGAASAVVATMVLLGFAAAQVTAVYVRRNGK